MRKLLPLRLLLCLLFLTGAARSESTSTPATLTKNTQEKATSTSSAPPSHKEGLVISYDHGLPGSKPIRFVGDHSYAPIEFMENGIAKGIFPEFLPHLARAMQRNVEYRLVEWKEAQRMVLAGEADVLTVFSPNPERNKQYAYSDEFLTFKFKLFVRDSDVVIHSLDDFTGKNNVLKVGVTKGGTPREIIEAYSDDINTVVIDNMPEGFERLLAGEIDAVATTEWVGAYLIQKHGFTGIKPVRTPFHSEAAPMGVRKDNHLILKLLNQGLALLEQEKTMEVLAREWSQHEVLYITKGAIKNYIVVLFGMLIGAAFLAGLLFIATLKRQVKEKTSSLEQSLHALSESQEKIIQLEKMAYLTKIVNGVAHEVNTPLSTAITALSFSRDLRSSLQEKFQNQTMRPADFRSYMDQSETSFQLIESSLSHTALLIDSFKSVSVNQKANEASEFAVNDVLHSSLDYLRNEIQEHHPEVFIDENANHHLFSIQGALFRVTTQLLRNSLTHAADQGRKLIIRFEQEVRGERFILTYSDNGKGLTKQQLDRIFDPFYTTQRNHINLGLGLSELYNVVTTVLEGTVAVTSQPNEGVTFTIDLPLKAQG